MCLYTCGILETKNIYPYFINFLNCYIYIYIYITFVIIKMNI